MTPEQEQHLRNIKSDFIDLVDSKYREGQKEHGGNLVDKNILELVNCTIDEAIDQVVYLLTLKEKLLSFNRKPNI